MKRDALIELLKDIPDDEEIYLDDWDAGYAWPKKNLEVRRVYVTPEDRKANKTSYVLTIGE